MEPAVIDIGIGILSGLGGGGATLVGYRLFKQKTEINDQQQFKDIKNLVIAQKESNELQQKNNTLQQKQIDGTDKEVMLLRERFQHHRETTEKFQAQILEEHKKTDLVLADTTSAIVQLKATMDGLKNVFELVLKKKDL